MAVDWRGGGDVRRPWLVAAGLALAALGTPLAVAAVAVVAGDVAPKSVAERVGEAIFVMLAATPAALGAWAVRRGDPGFGSRRRRNPAGPGAAPARRFELRRVAASPLGPGVAALAATAATLVVAPAATAAVALASLTLYSLLDPLANLARPSWWAGAALSVVTWLVLFLALPALAERAAPLREGLMVFLLPVTVYPVALALSGAVRLAGSLRRGQGPR